MALVRSSRRCAEKALQPPIRGPCQSLPAARSAAFEGIPSRFIRSPHSHNAGLGALSTYKRLRRMAAPSSKTIDPTLRAGSILNIMLGGNRVRRPGGAQPLPGSHQQTSSTTRMQRRTWRSGPRNAGSGDTSGSLRTRRTGPWRCFGIRILPSRVPGDGGEPMGTKGKHNRRLRDAVARFQLPGMAFGRAGARGPGRTGRHAEEQGNGHSNTGRCREGTQPDCREWAGPSDPGGNGSGASRRGALADQPSRAGACLPLARHPLLAAGIPLRATRSSEVRGKLPPLTQSERSRRYRGR